MKYIVLGLSIVALFYTTYLFTKSKKLVVGQKAPDFTAQALYPDGTIKEVTCADFLGKNIVLYFYPKDHTPVCTLQAQTFRDEYPKLEKQNIIVIGVSYDSVKKHKSFQCDEHLPYPLISDDTKKISKLYNASGWIMPQRKTILIDSKGMIVKLFEKVKVETQIQDILEAFKHK
ncbi:peroxiredoxin [bacterium]|nr:peroxiredoxin [bacterium]NBX78085.1 peroxiredoxin [bacterium]